MAIGRARLADGGIMFSACPSVRSFVRLSVFSASVTIYCEHDILRRSSAVADRPRDASCHWIFCKVTQDHSEWHCWV